MVKLVLFDFDGTIADTLNAGLQIYNMNADEQGFRKVHNVEEAKKLTVSEFLQQFRIPVYRVPFLLRKIHAMLNKNIHKIRLFNGMGKVIRELSNELPLGILSSNAENNIRKFLKSKKLESQFDFIVSYPYLFGKGSAVKKICKFRGIRPEDVLYIGDEVRDIVSIKKIRARMMAVTWGYNAKERLLKENPEWIVDDPQEIIRTVKKLLEN